MNDRNGLQRMLKGYGRQVELQMEDGWSSGLFHALINPVRYKNKIYLDGDETQIGSAGQNYYLYIGPPEHDLSKLEKTAAVYDGETFYQIERAEMVYLSAEKFYVWAILRRMQEDTE